MKILIVEDDLHKAARISSVLKGCVPKNDPVGGRLIHAKNIADARQHLSETEFDLMVLDVRIPIRYGEDPDDAAGIQLLEQLFIDEEYQRPRYVVGLSGIEHLYTEAAAKFHRHGWILLKYSPTDSYWSDSLAYFVKHINTVAGNTLPTHLPADIVVLAALEDPEFVSLREVFPELNGPRTLDGKTLYWEGEIEIGGTTLRVVAGYSWQMGLTAAAVLTDKFINTFKPRLVAMVGICAGFEMDIALGDVIVATQSWEWQGGKIRDTNQGPTLSIAPEPYRASQSVITDMHAMTAGKGFAQNITTRYFPQDTGSVWKVHFGPMVSGLSVVASAAVMDEAKLQHRKMLGLEMEAYAVYTAAEFNSHDCLRVVLKGVCDFGTSVKADNFQKIAAMRSCICLRTLLERTPQNYTR